MPLWTNSFIALLITQFMVALNDNLFRWLIIPIGKCAIGWSDSPDQVRMLGATVFLLPFLLCTAYAGYCTDRFDRRKVIIWCKIAELLIVILGTVAILTQSVPFMLIILFFLGIQAAFFSPAKYSSLPGIVPASRISEANGYYSMTTMIACIGGQILGGFLFVWTTLHPEAPQVGTGGMHHWWLWSFAIILVAVLGLISSFFIPSLPSVDQNAQFPLNPFYQTWSDLRFLFRHRTLFWIALGSSFFWGLGALGQQNIDKFAAEILHVRQDYAMILLVILSLGLAFGALLAGWWSRNRVEMGLIPFGVLMIVVCALVLSFTPTISLTVGQEVASPISFPFFYAGFGLLMLGIFAAVYDIPILTSLQTRSPVESRGRILAAYNFFSFSAMAIFSLVQGILGDPKMIGFSATQIWLFCAIISLPILIIAFRYQFIPFLDIVVAGFFHVFYRPRVIDPNNVPEEGGVLLVSNHVSYLDALLIYTSCRRPVRFIAHADYIPRGFASYVTSKINTIRIQPGDRKSVINMIREGRAALKNGEVLCIFAEGTLTRTGQIKSFEEGFLSLLKGNDDAVIVPVFLNELWGSIFSLARSYDSKRWLPGRLPRQMTIAFGQPMKNPPGAWYVRQTIQELGVESMKPDRFPQDRQLRTSARQMIRNCRRYPRMFRIGDTTGVRLNGRQTLLRILIMRRLIHRIFGPKEKYIGIILPTSVGGVLVNAATVCDRRIPVNLNYTFKNETIDYCIHRVGIKKILTSSRLLQKLPNLKPDAEILVLEDVLKGLSKWDKLQGLIESFMPTWLLERYLGLTKVKLNDLNTIIFTSGSTGLPKGAMLTESNVASNVETYIELSHLSSQDRLLGTLPLFHSFGYTTCVWTSLTQAVSCFFHYSPLDARIIGEVTEKEGVTIIPSTPTFLRNYLRRCPASNFAKVTMIVPGAEKLPPDLATAWKEKFGYPMSEGFGMTELSPVFSFNVPPSRFPDHYIPYDKPGSIGRPCAGFAVQIVHPETSELLPPNSEGMMEIKGPCVIPGYFDDPEKTKASFRNGWFVTGDIARIDEEGFIFITGRLTRMSKIGGEMVPHMLLEEKIEQILQDIEKENHPSTTENCDSNDTGIRFAVTSVPDKKKGEKIVVLYTELPVSPEEISKRILNFHLPLLWIPDAVNYQKVDNIPLLGTGKLDLFAIKQMALERYQQ